jgi:VWFA-related protein
MPGFQAILCVLLLSGLIIPTYAQQTIQANTRLVQINVLAQDSKGQPIPDLTQQDFTLQVSGRRRPIQVFSVERNGAQGPAPPETAQLPFSNRVASGDPNLVIILFDEYNTASMDVARARKQLVEVFSRLEPTSRIALYLLTKELKILLDFTTDRAALAAKLATHAPVPGFTTEGLEFGPVIETRSEALQAALVRAEAMVSDARSAHRVEVTLDALNLISAHVAGIPGRKTLVWLTGGVPMLIGYDPASFGASRVGQRDLSPEVIRTTRNLERADIAVDTVDLRGVRPDDQSRLRNTRRQLPTGQSPFETDPNYDAMMTLAKETGGEVFHNTNDIGRAVQRAIDDSQVSYTLGFYASQDELDGSYRSFRVQVNRHGVHLRYRSGFFATPDPSAQERLSQPLARLLGAPVTVSEISLRVELQHVPDGKYMLTVHVGPEGLDLRDEGGKRAGDFEWLAASARNGAYSAGSQRLHVALTPDAYREVIEHGLTLSQSIALNEGDTEIGAAIRDVSTGVAGTLRLFHKAQEARATISQ